MTATNDTAIQDTLKWEYHHEDWDNWPSLPQAMQRLANLGEKGWELVLLFSPPVASVENGDSRGVKLRALFKRSVCNWQQTDQESSDQQARIAVLEAMNQKLRMEVHRLALVVFELASEADHEAVEERVAADNWREPIAREHGQ